MLHKARRTSEDGLWRLIVVRGDHNHKPAENLHGHAYVGRLTSEENDMVVKMVDNKVKPGNMLLALKSVNPQNLTTLEIATIDKWLSMLDIGHIIATLYQILFVTLSAKGLHIPSLNGPVPHPSEYQIVCLLLVNNNHWVKAQMSSDFPLSLINPQWRYHCTVEARGWERPYLDHMARFVENIPQSDEVVDLVDS
ncbi:uncharacterized protein LOC130724892 [Lotus japonicus]|uniref:uncharacterized protein LOC130724892 n=1 Tax=Lotus japonicus TaxID=34305 RepID=UPI002590D0E5|nr:uncharacterized protein LOC130724892 [Lotus japonicus]